MRCNVLRYTIPMFLVVLLVSPPAHANVGLFPLWVVGWWAMFVALIPIIVIETIVLSVRAGTAFGESEFAATLGNLTSTVIGIPVAVIVHAILRDCVGDKPARVETAWQKVRMVIGHIQYEDGEAMRIPDWMWPAGCLVLMVPCFLASWLIESWIARMLMGDYPERVLDQAVFEANLVSYGILVALLSALLVWNIWKPSLASTSRAGLESVAEQRDPWRFANERARRGIARLKVAEAEIARQRPMRVATDVQRYEDACAEKAA